MTEAKNGLRFLNINVEEDVDEIYLSQEEYVNSMLAKYEMTDCIYARTPLDSEQNFNVCEHSPEANETLYQEMPGSLMYISVETRHICYIQIIAI